VENGRDKAGDDVQPRHLRKGGGCGGTPTSADASLHGGRLQTLLGILTVQSLGFILLLL
jgi:hypothetical protein